MYEAHSKYKTFNSVVKGVLNENGRGNLVNLLEQPRIKELFSHNVDHPVGYQDGPSGISLNAMKEKAFSLSEKDRENLHEIAEYSIRKIEMDGISLCSEDKRDLLLGANQLIQNADWQYEHGNGGWRREGKDQLERIAKLYIVDNSIARVREWDAQVVENQGFYHISKGGELYTTLAAFGFIPSAITAGVLFGPDFVKSFMLPLFVGGVLSAFANNLLLLPLQNCFGDEQSPNTAPKLVKNRQYRFLRHPLYSSRMLGDVLFGIASFPFGTYFSAKALYHNAEGCAKQDERMQILHGEEAVEYQNKTPAFIPGTKMLMKGLRKILSEKFCDALERPVSYYLSKFPGIKDENYYTDGWVTSPGYYKGEPTYHLGTLEERRAMPNALRELGREFVDVFKDMYRFSVRKIRKSKKRKSL